MGCFGAMEGKNVEDAFGEIYRKVYFLEGSAFMSFVTSVSTFEY